MKNQEWRVESYWSEKSLQKFPEISGKQKFDLLIIGGGFSGVSTALEVKKSNPTWRVGLIEKAILGSGASRKSGGWLVEFPPVQWLYFNKKSELQQRREFISRLKNYPVLKPQTITSWNEVKGNHHLISRNFFESIANQVVRRQIKGLGIDSQLIKFHHQQQQIVSYPYKDAITWPVHFINPSELLDAYLAEALLLGVEFFEKSEVANIEAIENEVRVQTMNGTIVDSDWAIVCTNGKPDFLKNVKTKKSGQWIHTYMLATEDLNDEEIKQISKDRCAFGDPSLNYFCGRFDGTKLLFSGADHDSNGLDSELEFAKAFDLLSNELRKRFGPRISSKVNKAWGGAVYETEDGLPLIGPVSRGSRIIANWGHGGGSGIKMALMSGLLINSLVSQNHGQSFSSHDDILTFFENQNVSGFDKIVSVFELMENTLNSIFKKE